MTTHYKLAIALGAMTALGPLAIDMYVPAMPDMAQDLATSDGAIHRSAMSFFFGFMLGQLVYGPLSDRFGRRYVVLSALSIFLVASVGSTMSGSVESLVVWRLVQGFGGAAGMSMAIAITRDLYVGKEAGRMMSLIMMVMGLAPILAPLLGSAIITIAPWPVIFLVLVFFALLAMTLTLLWVPETLPPADRNKSSGNVLTHYWQLLISQSFMPYAGTLALIQGAFFAYIVGSSFVIIKVFGLSSTQYALLFGLNAIGLTVGTQLLGRLGERIGAHRLVRAAVGGFPALP
jgi:DHA1 family bicyclomycin/chloramphenicol resistance-like MFS transporter